MNNPHIWTGVKSRQGEAPRLPVHHIVLPADEADRLNREIGRLTAELRTALELIKQVADPEHDFEVGEYGLKVALDGATLPAIAYWDEDCQCAGVHSVAINGVWVPVDGFDADTRTRWDEEAEIARRAEVEEGRQAWDMGQAEMLGLDRECGD